MSWRDYCPNESCRRRLPRGHEALGLANGGLCAACDPKSWETAAVVFESRLAEMAWLGHKAHTGFEPVFGEDGHA